MVSLWAPPLMLMDMAFGDSVIATCRGLKIESELWAKQCLLGTQVQAVSGLHDG